MAGTDTLHPGYTPSSGREAPPPNGRPGEAADNPVLERPDLRREVVVERSRVITVEEASGTAFAEASGAVERPAPTFIEPVPQPNPIWRNPLLLGAAVASGVLLAMLTGSTRTHRGQERSEPDAPAAFPMSGTSLSGLAPPRGSALAQQRAGENAGAEPTNDGDAG